MNPQPLLGFWVRRFLMEYLVAERNLARNTQTSYRDTMTLLLPFAARAAGTPIDRLTVEELSATIVRGFLDYLEKARHCSVATRNQRLGTIHSMAKFIATRSPEHISWCGDIRKIPFKKTNRPVIAYLDPPEMNAVLDAPDRKTAQGTRDHALLLFLYNTGARANEAARLEIGDVTWGSAASVRLVGKGNKTRFCPLWPKTAHALRSLVRGRPMHEHLFMNRRGAPLTRFGIYALVKRAVVKGSLSAESLTEKRISPHCIRHTSAVHLLRGGVDINTIRAWLGHVSLQTTNVYAEVDLEMKAKALKSMDTDGGLGVQRRWHKKPDLLEFLRRI
jgi:integrase/recombinase XerD